MLMYTSAEVFAETTAAVHDFRTGEIHAVKCSAFDYEKINGATITVFMDENGLNRVFVKKKPDGTLTDYEKTNGHLTDGIGFFHYLDRYKKGHWSKYHFTNNDWTDMTRGNWETPKAKNQGSPAERRYRKLGVR